MVDLFNILKDVIGDNFITTGFSGKGVIVADKKGRIRQMNRAALKIWDCKEKEMIGKKVSNLLPGLAILIHMKKGSLLKSLRSAKSGLEWPVKITRPQRKKGLGKKSKFVFLKVHLSTSEKGGSIFLVVQRIPLKEFFELMLREYIRHEEKKMLWKGKDISSHLFSPFTDGQMDGHAEKFKMDGHAEKFKGEMRRAPEKEKDGSRMNTLMRAVLEGEEKERRRIASDLHDSIQPLLSALRYRLDSLDLDASGNSPRKKAEYEAVVRLLERAQKEVTTISYNLTPPTLEELGLPTALRDLCANIDRNDDLHVDFYHSGNEREVNASIKASVYRIAQEMINNAIKHSNATKIQVQLITNEDNLILIVEDNGKGFDLSSQKKGLGIRSMSARVKALRGKLNIDSQINVGTTITAEIPSQK